MTPAQLAALAAYIAADPVFAPHLAAGSDQQIADIINARTEPVVGGVSRARFAIWAGSTGLRAVIADHAATQGSPLRSIALTLTDFLVGGVADTLDLSDISNQQMLGAWVAVGALTQAQADELIALATTDQPVFGHLSNTDIARALGRNGLEGL